MFCLNSLFEIYDVIGPTINQRLANVSFLGGYGVIILYGFRRTGARLLTNEMRTPSGQKFNQRYRSHIVRISLYGDMRSE